MIKHIFVSIDDEFYNSLYCGFAEGESTKLVNMPGVVKWSKLKLGMLGWKTPFPWARAKLFGDFWGDTEIKNIQCDNIENTRNCYIIYGRILQFYGPYLLTYLKKKDPDSFFVCYLGDVVSTFSFDIETVKRQFDLVFSCDRKDANKHGLLFLQAPYSYINMQEVPLEYDFSYIGNEKERLDKIINIFEILNERGYKCKFLINGVKKEKQIYAGSIIYNQYINYHQVVDIIKRSRCIVEVMQTEADTTTTRYSEALLYKKYLLTDSDFLKKYRGILPNIISVDYQNWEGLSKICEPLTYDITEYIEDLSVKTMISSIDYYLN